MILCCEKEVYSQNKYIQAYTPFILSLSFDYSPANVTAALAAISSSSTVSMGGGGMY
jgi:uncharacterized membrane protein